ncbi:MAG: helix-turn-helix transcriptional regulator [Neomegalonema sp.]|nr:helix-turn-helix transcriptional regulator [Neomegalonema sp.]
MNKSPNPIDVHVGGRVRLRRMVVGMSQEKLGEQLGLTFQQVQKYEKGANRIGASRLFEIARLLGVTVQFFFEDLPDGVDPGVVNGMREEAHDTAGLMEFVSSAEGLQLNMAFSQIDSAETRKRIVDLVKTLAGPEERPKQNGSWHADGLTSGNS